MTHTPIPERSFIDLADWLDEQRHLILADRTEQFAERELECLIEIGEFARVEKICKDMLKRLPKVNLADWVKELER